MYARRVRSIAVLLATVGRSPVLAVSIHHVFVDGVDLFSILIHAHHVPRDVHTDRSAQGVTVKDAGAIRPDLLNIAIQVALVPHVDTSAKARKLTDEFRIRYRKAVGF